MSKAQPYTLQGIIGQEKQNPTFKLMAFLILSVCLFGYSASNNTFNRSKNWWMAAIKSFQHNNTPVSSLPVFPTEFHMLMIYLPNTRKGIKCRVREGRWGAYRIPAGENGEAGMGKGGMKENTETWHGSKGGCGA